MKKTLAFSLLVSIVLFFVGCAKKEKPALVIGSIRISAQEFEDAFQKEGAFRQAPMDKVQFLDLYLSRKLMLKEAEELGLDKDPQFLKSLQLFWEQALLKLVLARKLNELAVGARVSEEEVAQYYQRHRDSDYAGKELAEVHDQIKSLLFRIKQRLLLKDWETNLRTRTAVEIDYGQLDIPKE
jgi:hypothetical protein